MNRKFLSTLLTFAVASFNLKADTRVVEVEMEPAKLVEVKLSPQALITESKLGFGIESTLGVDNFSAEINGEWMWSQDYSLYATNRFYFDKGFRVGVKGHYYNKANRRSGLYSSLGFNFLMGGHLNHTEFEKSGKFDIAGDYKYAVTASFGIGHKIEVADFLFISNSLEYVGLLPLIGTNVERSKDLKKSKKNHHKYHQSNSFISNLKVNLLEISIGY